MRAAVLTSYDRSPSASEFPAPEPDNGNVVVDVAAAGVNHVDLMKASGTFYTGAPPLPSVVGSDGVGRLADGRRVYFDTTVAPYGAIAEQALVDPADLLDVPDGVDDAVAAAMGNCGLAAWLALTRRAQLAPGETVLVLGASGAVGGVAVQAAKVLGAGRVIAAARAGERLSRLVERGADAIVELDAADDPHAAFAAAPPDVTIDLLWGAPAVAAMRAAAHGARHIQIGHIAAPTAEIAAAAIRAPALDVRGFAVFHHPLEERRAAYRELGEQVLAGRIAMDVERVPLDGVAAAWERQRAGAGVKLIVTP
ncbi:MAG TPA: zinc-binding dehydrogenase [Solirubrobacter sp.]|nr:zinc-binding dehydrogenase [Solirubrobacter sp.]